jgi:hypothetical protein
MDNDLGTPRRVEGHRASIPDNNTAARCQFDISVLLARFSLRQLHFIYRHFEGDLALAIVLGEVALHNLSRFQGADKSMSPGGVFWERSDLQKLLLPCNALSISQSTGIPRETVRRKIAKLVEMGWMEQNTKGEITITRAVCLKFAPEFNAEMTEALLHASDGIREFLEKTLSKTPSSPSKTDQRPHAGL